MEEYSSHADYMALVCADADLRCQQLAETLLQAFRPYVQTRSTEVIVFSEVSAVALGEILADNPSVLKALLAICNVAGRAVERDLGIKNVDTYRPRLDPQEASALAGYIKPFLPPYVEIGALCHIDRVAYVDKEVRKSKRRWEQTIVAALNRFGRLDYKKRQFRANGESFELDAAAPLAGPIQVGVDVKRIEARRDIHKRSDEIVNKATKLKSAYPDAKFGAVIYYPFPTEHVNVQHRLQSDSVDAVVFAGESVESVENAVRMLLATLGEDK